MRVASWLDGINGALSHCRVAERFNTYQLRATLPKKADARATSYQTISTGLKATPDNVALLKAMALELDEQIQSGTFSWVLWSKEALKKRAQGIAADGITPAEFASAIEETFRHKHPGVEQSWKTAWGKKFSPAYKRMRSAPVAVVDEAALRDLLLSNPSLAARKTDGSIYSITIAFKGWKQFDRSSIFEASAGYTAAELTPRDIPSDEELLGYYEEIDAPHWKWLYGIMLTYGIRPHEIVYSSLTADGRLDISEGKTGAREAWPCKPEWVRKLNLREEHRPTQSYQTVAKAASDYFAEKKPGRPGIRTRPARLPFSLYTLRHAYAIRLMADGYNSDLSAKLMGHSVRVHTETYRRWLNKSHMDAMFKKQLKKRA
ncbi:hypothetical protein Syn8016DRAFT_0757 [Synechococcus sp. WH 8016]|nr:hypothetical protein Syn8016DRAFT_0757 [Synechococcus sp. WH 8016]